MRFEAATQTGAELGHGTSSFYLNAQPSAQHQALDARLAPARSEPAEEPSVSASELLGATAAGVAAGLACWIVAAIACTALRRRTIRAERPTNDGDAELQNYSDDRLWR